MRHNQCLHCAALRHVQFSKLTAEQKFSLQILSAALCQVATLLGNGRVAPLQSLAYSFADVLPAFRQFSRAQHVGKLVVRMPSAAGKGACEEEGRAGSWVITGGLGSLGLLTADWLAGQGHAHILLLGRTGRPAEEALASGTGGSAAQLTMARCDTSQPSEAAAVVPGQGSLTALPHVTGIINSGGVLADGVIGKQSAASLRISFAPKLASTLAVHRSAAVLPVSQLLLFSSIASLLGSLGQANYAAANAALEGWVVAAGSQGLNGVAIQWGAWAAGENLHHSLAIATTMEQRNVPPKTTTLLWCSVAGMAANDKVMQRARRSGVGVLQPYLGLDGLRTVMATGLQPHVTSSLVAVVPFDWTVLLKVRLLRHCCWDHNRGGANKQTSLCH